MGIRATQIAAESGEMAQGMTMYQILRTYDSGARALNAADYLALVEI